MSNPIKDDYYVDGDKISTKNDLILEELIPFIENILEADSDKRRAKLMNPATQTKNKLNSILRREPPFPNTQMYRLSSEDIWKIYLNYLDLNAKINSYFPYIMDKLEFCAYARISLTYYNNMIDEKTDGEETPTEEMSLRDVFSAINADIVNSTLSGAETGAISGVAARMRSKAKKVGNSVIEVDDNAAIVDSLAEAAKGALYHAQKLELAQKYRPKISEK